MDLVSSFWYQAFTFVLFCVYVCLSLSHIEQEEMDKRNKHTMQATNTAKKNVKLLFVMQKRKTTLIDRNV